ncbi:hypothetical protein [Azospirillum argentinense]
MFRESPAVQTAGLVSFGREGHLQGTGRAIFGTPVRQFCRKFKCLPPIPG